MGGGGVWVLYSKALSQSPDSIHSSSHRKRDSYLVQFQLESIVYSLKLSLLYSVSISIPVTMACSKGGCICIGACIRSDGVAQCAKPSEKTEEPWTAQAASVRVTSSSCSYVRGSVKNEGQSL